MFDGIFYLQCETELNFFVYVAFGDEVFGYCSACVIEMVLFQHLLS